VDTYFDKDMYLYALKTTFCNFQILHF